MIDDNFFNIKYSSTHFREYIKETWGGFTDTYRPFLQLGCALLSLRKHKSYLTWGHGNIQAYLENELHLPFTNYALFIAAARYTVIKLELTPNELREVEQKYSNRRVITIGKVSRTKHEFFQRLDGKFTQENVHKTERIGPFALTRKEMDILRIAGLTTGFPIEGRMTKRDILILAITVVGNNKPGYERDEWIKEKLRKYHLNKQ